MYLRRISTRKKSFDIPIVSVGNLIVGGSGKTPFVIDIASRFEDLCIVSRGYGRQSKGLLVVSRNGQVLVDVTQSGDEPMLMATSLPQASVIVSEDRHKAIVLAKEQGAKLIIGPFREFFSQRKYADIIVKEGKDFTRHVMVQDAAEKMVLVTAISNPTRLDRYLPEGVVAKVYFEDHAYFDEQILVTLLEKHQADSLLCTSKDRVKMRGFKLPISEMKLKLEIQNKVFMKIEDYIEGYRSEK